jgi:hypothetical protein
LIEAVAVELPRLIEGDDGGFMSRLALIMNPPQPKSPGPKTPSAKLPKPDGEADDKPGTGPNTEAINGGNADGL